MYEDDVVDDSGEPAVGSDTAPDGGAAPGSGAETDDGGDDPLSTGDASLDALIDQVDNDLLGGGGGDTGGSSDDDDAPVGGGGANARLKAFVDKNYGGDMDAFLASQYSSREHNQSLRRELDELKARLDSPNPPNAPDPEETFKSAREQNSLVRSIGSEIAQIDAEIKAFTADQQRLVADATSLAGEIKTLEGKLASTDDSEQRAQIRYDLSTRRAEMQALDSKFESKESMKANNKRTLAVLRRDLSRVEADIRADLEQQQTDAVAQEQSVAQINEDFDAAFVDAVSQYAVDLKSKDPKEQKRARYVYQSTRAILADWLMSQKDKPALNTRGIQNAVRNILQQAEDAGTLVRRAKSQGPGHRLTPGSGGAGRTASPRPVVMPKTSVNGRGGVPVRKSSTAPKSMDDVFSDADLIRKRADRLATEFAKSQAQRGRGRGRGPLA